MVNTLPVNTYPKQQLPVNPHNRVNQGYANYPAVNYAVKQDQFNHSPNTINVNRAKELKEQGNTFRLRGQYEKAIQIYKQALAVDPNYTDVLYNLGRTYRDTGNMQAAIETFKRLVQIDPKDFESRTLLGAYYERIGDFDNALTHYKEVLRQEPNYDYARRDMYRAYVKKLALTDPNGAEEIKQKISRENLQKALELVRTSAPPYINANLQGIKIEFGTTEEVNKYENLAQYENDNKRILISNKLLYASPNVIATYLVHEAVHAGDKDPITSVREEQDAFGEMTRFWIKNNNNLLDPDLTLAMNLYQEHPDKLDAKVANIYIKRDPNIRRTSPNHGEASGNSILSNLYESIRSWLPAQGMNGSATPEDAYVPAQTYYQPFMPYPVMPQPNPFCMPIPAQPLYNNAYGQGYYPVPIMPVPHPYFVPAFSQPSQANQMDQQKYINQGLRYSRLH